MQSTRILLLLAHLIGLPLTAGAGESGRVELERQVERVERAFAQTMADRDFDAFTRFLDPETVFFSDEGPLRGSVAVADRWKAYFEAPEAPFSWSPETVQVLDSGGLAFSSGPVFDPSGQRVATFHSVWRLDGDGEWRIVFDKGSRYCE